MFVYLQLALAKGWLNTEVGRIYLLMYRFSHHCTSLLLSVCYLCLFLLSVCVKT